MQTEARGRDVHSEAALSSRKIPVFFVPQKPDDVFFPLRHSGFGQAQRWTNTGIFRKNDEASISFLCLDLMEFFALVEVTPTSKTR